MDIARVLGYATRCGCIHGGGIQTWREAVFVACTRLSCHPQRRAYGLPPRRLFLTWGQELYVSRTEFTGELGYEVYAFGGKTDHPRLWNHLMASGEPHGLEFSSTRSMTIRRIEAGIFGNITDMDTTMTPFEAGLAAFVDMDKESFVGKDALVGKDQRTLLFGLVCPTAVPGRGSEVF